MNLRKFISHRGNLLGKIPEFENHPEYIKIALGYNFDVEIDLWWLDGFYLGHDFPQYKINCEFLDNKRLWINCKNIEALTNCRRCEKKMNYFFHDVDKAVLTSCGFIWTYPGEPVSEHSVMVLPEVARYSAEDFDVCYAICSDNILCLR